MTAATVMTTTSSQTGGYLIVIDGRQTPVPQGASFAILPGSFIPTDPGSRRLFPRIDLGTDAGRSKIAGRAPSPSSVASGAG